jgi:hypothetical protein
VPIAATTPSTRPSSQRAIRASPITNIDIQTWRGLDYAIPVIFKDGYNKAISGGSASPTGQLMFPEFVSGNADWFIETAKKSLEIKRGFQIDMSSLYGQPTPQQASAAQPQNKAQTEPQWKRITAFEYGIRPDLDDNVKKLLGGEPKSNFSLLNARYNVFRDKQSGQIYLDNFRLTGDISFGFYEGYLPQGNKEAAEMAGAYIGNRLLSSKIDAETEQRLVGFYADQLHRLAESKGAIIRGGEEAVARELVKQRLQMSPRGQFKVRPITPRRRMH